MVYGRCFWLDIPACLSSPNRDCRLPTEKVQLVERQWMYFCWAWGRYLGTAVGFTTLAGREQTALHGQPIEKEPQCPAFEEGWRNKENKSLALLMV